MRNNWKIFAEKILEHFDLSEYFDFIGGSNLDGTRVKKNEIITHVLEENQMESYSDIIMIGDRKHDVIGAKK